MKTVKSWFPVLVPFLALAAGSAAAQTNAPEMASGRTEQIEAHGRKTMVVTAEPLASKAADAMLAQGGSAVDAAIAASLVLGLVEPQASGLGGGGLALFYDADSRTIDTYDGRETAPATATPEHFLDAQGKPITYLQAIASGRVVGTPGLVRLLDLMHHAHGKLPWAKLFEPAIKLAEDGFPVTQRTAIQLAGDRKRLEVVPEIKAYFFTASGEPLRAGALLKNPDYAETLRDIAAHGPNAFYQGPRAARIVARVSRAIDEGPLPIPARLTLGDLMNYRAKQRPVVCGYYHDHHVCGMGPPSSGGIAIIEMLGQLEAYDLEHMKPDSVYATHLMMEASRRAFADRDLYIGDPDQVAVPVAGLIDRDYIQSRGLTIDPTRVAVQQAPAGVPAGLGALPGRGVNMDQPSTTHMSIVDAQGNAVAMTQTIESGFGAHVMVDGFLLNNQLTDFNFQPLHDGKPSANAPGPRKRPRSTMTPTIVMDRADHLEMIVGSPGGSSIAGFVLKTLVAHFDWHMGGQDAVNWPIALNRNGPTEIEADTVLAKLKPQLETLGHQVRLTPMVSGLNVIVIGPDGLSGASDPRREGLAIGRD